MGFLERHVPRDSLDDTNADIQKEGQDDHGFQVASFQIVLKSIHRPEAHAIFKQR